MNNHDNMSPFMVAIVGFFIDDKPQEPIDEIDVEGLM